MSDIKLTAEQLEYVNSTEPYTIVLACPGSGKTEILSSKIARLVGEGIDAERILAITFTKKAASEMRRRIKEKTGIPFSKLKSVSTFHAFGLKVIRNNHKYFGLPENFKIATDKVKAESAERVLLDENIERCLLRDFLQLVSMIKNGMKVDTKKYAWFDETLVDKYDNKLKILDNIDIDDAIFKVLKLFKDEKANLLRDNILNSYDYIFVDEYQDVNGVQAELLNYFEVYGKKCSYVGDDDQAIYRFRGSEPRYLIEKSKDEKFKKYYLTTNFRSDESVVNFANSFLESINQKCERIEKHRVTAKNKGGILPSVSILKSGKVEEIEYICDTIADLVVQKGLDPSQIAVLSRYGKMNNHCQELMEVKEGLSKRKIKATNIISDNERNFDSNVAVMELCQQLESYVYGGNLSTSLCYLRNDYSKFDFTNLCSKLNEMMGINLEAECIEESLELICSNQKIAGISFGEDREGIILTDFKNRIIKKYLFIKEQRRIVSEGVRVSEIISNIIGFALREDIKIEGSMRALYSCKVFALNYEGIKKATVDDYKDTVEFLKTCYIDDDLVVEEGKVSLLTAHKSKGLEFDVVFVMGMEAGNFPSVMEGADIETEMRLFYVAITRAKHLLYVTAHNIATDIYDDKLVSKSFIANIDKKYLENKIVNLDEVNFYSDPNSIYAKARAKDKHIEELNQHSLDNKKKIEELEAEMKADKEKLQHMDILMAQSDSLIRKLNERETENKNLSQSVTYKNAEIFQLHKELETEKKRAKDSVDKGNIKELEAKIKIREEEKLDAEKKARKQMEEIELLKKEIREKNVIIKENDNLEERLRYYQQEYEENQKKLKETQYTISALQKDKYGDKLEKLDEDFKKILKNSIEFFSKTDMKIALNNSSIADRYLNSIQNISFIDYTLQSTQKPDTLKRKIEGHLFRDQMVPVIREILSYIYQDKRMDSIGIKLSRLSKMEQGKQISQLHILEQYKINYSLLFEDKLIFRHMAVLTSVLSDSFHSIRKDNYEWQKNDFEYFYSNCDVEEQRQIVRSYYYFIYTLIMAKRSEDLFADIANYRINLLK